MYLASCGTVAELHRSLSILAVTAVGHIFISEQVPYLSESYAKLAVPRISICYFHSSILSSTVCIAVLAAPPTIWQWPVTQRPLSSSHFGDHLVIVFLVNTRCCFIACLIAYSVDVVDGGNLTDMLCHSLASASCFAVLAAPPIIRLCTVICLPLSDDLVFVFLADLRHCFIFCIRLHARHMHMIMANWLIQCFFVWHPLSASQF